MARYLIGIDDTDAGDSIGTGALSRELLLLLLREHPVESLGITRHQLLVHPDIPYTSHNSSACLVIQGEVEAAGLAGSCRRILELLFHPGADPGLCIARPESVGPEIVAFGQRAQRQVVEAAEAWALARRDGILLEEHGGTGLGVIGALAACGLRAGGGDGRFIALRGIRDVADELTVGELLARTAIDVVLDEAGAPVADPTRLVTNGWIRPELDGGRVVQRVRRTADGTCVVEKRKKNQDDM